MSNSSLTADGVLSISEVSDRQRCDGSLGSEVVSRHNTTERGWEILSERCHRYNGSEAVCVIYIYIYRSITTHAYGCKKHRVCVVCRGDVSSLYVKCDHRHATAPESPDV